MLQLYNNRHAIYTLQPYENSFGGFANHRGPQDTEHTFV